MLLPVLASVLFCGTAAATAAPSAADADALAQNREAFLAGKTNDCPGCNLDGVSLKYRDLQGANLAGADLDGVNLHRANLANANLSGATIRQSNLNKTILRNANLSGADLRDTII
jgi:uncharacterized protein YjbI with pentapeptide repeats